VSDACAGNAEGDESKKDFFEADQHGKAGSGRNQPHIAGIRY
jgi:hypothetical protein